MILLLLFTLSIAVPAQKKRSKTPRLKGGSDVVLPLEVPGGEGMEFHLHLPSGWKARSRKKNYPTLLVLHGNGQAPENAFRKFRSLSTKKTPLIVMAPKYQKEKRFNAERWPRDVCMKGFDWLREQAMEQWHGDPDRFFVEGFSMGGSYSCLYVTHMMAKRKEGQALPIRAVILNSGVAFRAGMEWPEQVPTLCTVGEKETAVLGRINLVKDMTAAANGLLRGGADVRFHLIPGMKHAVNQECLNLARDLIFEECGPARSPEKEIALFKRKLRREGFPVTRLRRIERMARSLSRDSRAERIQKSIAKLYDLPAMVSELEAWKLWENAIEADKPSSPERRNAYEALVKSHPKTEAGRRAKDRLGWMD
jgi:acetyl esterase/lipase